jgi:negative regulator of flagellin synthesis FlgM
MKIGPIDLAHAPAAGAADRTERRPGGSPAAGHAAEPSARVELSTSAASGSAASGAASPEDGSFDAAKVERIAQAIRDGRFQVNAEAIADKLIANAQELLGGNPS